MLRQTKDTPRLHLQARSPLNMSSIAVTTSISLVGRNTAVASSSEYIMMASCRPMASYARVSRSFASICFTNL